MRRTKPPVGWEHVKNCFPVPNELLEFDLPGGAIAVYIYLLRHPDRRIGQCHPSAATMAKKLHYCRNTVANYVRLLEERGLIVTENTEIITKRGIQFIPAGDGQSAYGSFNNYLFCEEHGMKKYMKFTMYEEESKNKRYRNDPYRAVNFGIDRDGCMICPNGKRFHFLRSSPVKGNQYGRTEEYYQCEDCEGCPHRERCHKSSENRIVRMNEELTRFHEEVLENLNSVQGALLRMNRSIQAEGAFGGIKWNRGYKRLRRRGLEKVILELRLISCGFNLHKYHLKRMAALLAA